MVTAGLKNPPLKYVEMFTKNAYEKPKHKETLRVFGLVSSCGQLIVEPHPIKTKSIEQTDSTTDEMKMVTILCHCTMIKAGVFCWSFVLFTKRSACPGSIPRGKSGRVVVVSAVFYSCIMIGQEHVNLARTKISEDRPKNLKICREHFFRGAKWRK